MPKKGNAHSVTISLFLFVFTALLHNQAKAGTIYVEVRGHQTNSLKSLNEYSVNGTPLNSFPGLAGLVVDSQGFLYAEKSDRLLHKFDRAGNDLGAFLNSHSDAQCFDFDQSGNLYAGYYGQRGTGRIEKYSATGGDVGIFAPTGSVSDPYFMAFNGLGDLYVSDWDADKIRKFNPTGVSLGTFASPSLPLGIAFDSHGNLFVACWNQGNGDGSVCKYGPTGASLGVFATAGISFPAGLAIDDEDNVYVVNAYGDEHIHKFSATGTDLGKLISFPSGSRPWNIAYVSVPEPSSCIGIIVLAMGMAVLRQDRFKKGRTLGRNTSPR